MAKSNYSGLQMRGLEKLLVALVRGPIVFATGAVNNEATPAIAYAYIISYLRRRGCRVVMIDAIGEGLNRTWPLKEYSGFRCHGLHFDEIISRIPKGADVIGFSGMFSGEWPVLRKLIIMVREHFPEALIVAGGEHITALTEFSLRDCSALDVCIRGEGEHTFYTLLKSYSEAGDFSNIDGIGYLDEDGCYQQNGDLPPRIRDIDRLPWPHWPNGYLEKFWKAGKSYGIASKTDMPLMVSRGCPYLCTFCSSPHMWTSKYILREVKDVIEEIKYYIEQYSISSVQLYDLTAIIKKKWIVEFCKQLIEEDIKLNWSIPSGTRSEALDSEVIGLLKLTGCNYLVYAPESGSPYTLNNIKKRINLSQLSNSVMEAKQHGLTVRTNLVIGFPCETRRDIFETLLYGLKMSIKGVDEVPIFIFSPYPGTEIFNELLDSGDITLNDEYFFQLTSLNGSYFSTNVISFNPYISSRELVIIRLIFTLSNYGISYFLRPYRIVRTLWNLLSNSNEASTVLEHRMKDLLNRRVLKSIRKKDLKL